MNTRLIIKNLPPSADEKRLRIHFGAEGHITDVKVLRKKDGSSRGFAFIGFKNEAQAEHARQYFDRSCLGACKLSVSAAEAFKPSQEAKSVLHKTPVQTAAVQGGKGEQVKTDGRSSKLGEFLGLMRPQSKSKTFANEPANILSVRPEDGVGAAHFIQKPVCKGAHGPAPKVIDSLATDDSISDLEYLKSRVRTSGIAGAEQRSTAHDSPEAKSPNLHEPQLDPTIQESLTNIQSTGRIFCRNLAYSTADEDVRTLMENFGSLTECRVLRSKSGVSKGIAFVSFSSTADAVSAFEDLDGAIFQGRLLHLLPGKLKKLDSSAGQVDNGPNSTFKAAREKERKAKAGDRTSWSTLYMRDDTVAEAVADLLGISKGELLDPEAPDAAVRLTLGETQVLAATKEDLSAKGVNVETLEAAAQQSGHTTAVRPVARSKTVLLLKNLPFLATEESIHELFDRDGGCIRLVLPRTRALALVELADEHTARSAFKRLAYKRFHNVPLYLEFAPEGILEKQVGQSQEQVPVRSLAAEGTPEHADALEFCEPGETHESSTLFIKGLSFTTTQASLQKRCTQAAEAAGGVLRSVKMPMKLSNEGKSLMQGYAFAEFGNHSTAKSVMQKLGASKIDGHTVVVEISQTASKDPGRSSKKRDRSGKSVNKIMVRNLAFEATAKDVRQLMEAFGHVKTCRLPKKFDGSTRGFAFVEFATKGEAQKAMSSAHGAHLYGRRLLIEYAKGEEGVDELRSKMSNGT